MSEIKNMHWLEGFTKFASDCGVQDPQAIVSLMKVHQTLQALKDHPSEFNKGAEAVLQKSGQAGSLKTLLALLAGGIGTHLATKGYQGLKTNLANQYMGEQEGRKFQALGDVQNQIARAKIMKNMFAPDKGQGLGYDWASPFHYPIYPIAHA